MLDYRLKRALRHRFNYHLKHNEKPVAIQKTINWYNGLVYGTSGKHISNETRKEIEEYLQTL